MFITSDFATGYFLWRAYQSKRTRSEKMTALVNAPSDCGSVDLIHGHSPSSSSLLLSPTHLLSCYLPIQSTALLTTATNTRLRRKQASLLLPHVWSHHRVFVPVGPLLGLIFCWQPHCSSTSFRTCLECYRSSGPLRPSSMKQDPSHFLSSLWFILFFSALATTWPILYWFILHLSPFE